MTPAPYLASIEFRWLVMVAVVCFVVWAVSLVATGDDEDLTTWANGLATDITHLTPAIPAGGSLPGDQAPGEPPVRPVPPLSGTGRTVEVTS